MSLMAYQAQELDFTYEPLPQQEIYFTCPAEEVFYGGAAGGGKTDAAIVKSIVRALMYPGYKALILRRSFPQLTEIVLRMFQLIPKSLAKYNVGNHHWRFHNGSIIILSHLERDASVHNHQGQSYDDIFFDEGTHFTEYQIEYLKSRLRTVLPEIIPSFNIGSNPGSVGHAYCLREYVEPAYDNVELLYFYSHSQRRWLALPEGMRGRPRPFVVWKMPENETHDRLNRERAAESPPLPPLPLPTRCFIPAKVQDNKYYANDGRYLARLALLPPAERQALLDGNWHLFEGQAFPEFDERLHVLPAGIVPPAHWPKWRSLDWGYSAPMAVYWHALDPATGTILTYRELYATKLDDERACETIRALTPEAEWIFTTYADPSLFDKDSSDQHKSLADRYAERGLPMEPANNARITGKAAVHQRLAINPRTARPGWLITRNCTNLIRTLPQLVYSEKRPEDIDTDGEDHAYDACRYGLIMAQGSVVPTGLTITAGSFVKTKDSKYGNAPATDPRTR